MVKPDWSYVEKVCRHRFDDKDENSSCMWMESQQIQWLRRSATITAVVILEQTEFETNSLCSDCIQLSLVKHRFHSEVFVVFVALSTGC
jgi:3-methyladenine DNA glycosylase AlkD